MNGCRIGIWFVLATAVAAQEAALPAVLPPAATVRDPRLPAGERCRALAALQAAGCLDVPLVLVALTDADDEVAAAATAIVRHEWTTLPAGLLAGLDAAPLAARRFLHELALAPRPAATPWIEAWGAISTRSADDRCLALAARGRPLGAAEAELLLRTLLAGDAGDGFAAATPLLTPAAADRMLGRLHAHLASETLTIDQVTPFLDRLSPDGCRGLLGMIVTLPAELARRLAQRVAERDPTLVHERVRAMLDSSMPIEAVWLDYAGPLLDRPERVARVLALLDDAGAEMDSRQRAFGALLEAKVAAEPMFRFATAEGAPLSSAQRLLGAVVDRMPGALVVDWLDGAPGLSTATVHALVRRPQLGDAVEAALLDKLPHTDGAEGVFFNAAAMALVQHGSETALDAAWPTVRAATGWSDFVDALGRRREPFVHELLLTELDAPAPAGMSESANEARLDAVRLALVTLGDQRQLATLVAHAKQRSATFVRRCTHHARPLPVRFALQLLDAVAGSGDLDRGDLDQGDLEQADLDRAVEMVAWAASSVDAAVVARLQQLWASTDASPRAEALREVAARALARGNHRERFVAELRAALAAGPLPAPLEPLCFELVSETTSPLSVEDARFLAELLLLPPLSDPDLELQQRSRWPDGRFGFPLVAAIAQRLRGAEPGVLTVAFAAVVDMVARDPRRTAISRQRLLVLWRSLEADPEVQRTVALQTAELMLALPDDADTGAGPAHWFCMQKAEERGDFTAAVAHARAAIAGLLRLPEERRTARLFLGEREPGSGRDPWAALAASPHRLASRAAFVRGDAATATTARALVREFAGHDTATLATIDATNPEDPNR